MIRHSIICDICGVERKQANHWFTAQEHDGEFRVGAFLQSKAVRPGLKHLCGQTCLHRLVDEFLARHMGGRPPLAADQISPNHTAVGEEKIAPPSSQQWLPSPTSAGNLNASFSDEQSNLSSPYAQEQWDDFESSAVLIPSPPPKDHLKSSDQAVPRKILTLPKKKPQSAVSKAATVSRIATASFALPSQTRRTVVSALKASPQTSVRQSSTTSQPPRNSRIDSKANSQTPPSLQPAGTPVKSLTEPLTKPKILPSEDAPILPLVAALPRTSVPVSVLVNPPVYVPPADRSNPILEVPLTKAPTFPASTPTRLRSIASAWERARLWESRSSHDRQLLRKKS